MLFLRGERQGQTVVACAQIGPLGAAVPGILPANGAYRTADSDRKRRLGMHRKYGVLRLGGDGVGLGLLSGLFRILILGPLLGLPCGLVVRGCLRGLGDLGDLLSRGDRILIRQGGGADHGGQHSHQKDPRQKAGEFLHKHLPF